MTTKVSKLISVAIRDVWPFEAGDFTPWLLANAEALGEVLGIDLEFDGSEHKVGGFSLDLVGREVGTDEVVIVENQFGPTDHRHLGQLLTYAGGTDPKTVVWIAESFRDEHRAALDWLNLRSDSTTRFFGVQLRAVTIAGGSPDLVAPLLDVVAKPNDWGKAVRSATHATSPREQLYLQFWTQWLERVKPRKWTNRQPVAKHWLRLPSGSPRSRYTVSFRSGGLLSELFFSHSMPEVNVARLEVLESRRAAIEKSFGGPLTFDALPTKKGSRIGIFRNDGESIESDGAWNDYLNWFEDTQARLRTAIDSTGGIPPIPEELQGVDGDEDLDSEDE